MKIIILILLTLFTGCTIQPAPENLDERAEYVSNAFNEQNFGAIVKLFDERMDSILDKKTLEAVWEDSLLQLGEFKSEKGIEIADSLATITKEYEIQDVTILIDFDDELNIAGIDINLIPLEAFPTITDTFAEEEIFINTQEDISLGGFLTVPKNVENPPVVLLVSGWYSADRNNSIMQNSPFRDIAHSLAEQGIATLRYDKRFSTYYELIEQMDYTLDEELFDDASHAISILEQDTRFSEIYVLGHFTAGMIAPALCEKHESVSGIISMSGFPVPLYEIIYREFKAGEASMLEGVTDEFVIDSLNTQFQNNDNDIAMLRDDFTQEIQTLIILGMPLSYQQSAKDYADHKFLENLKVPMLILHGEDDFDSLVDVEFEMYKEILKDNEDVTFKLYEGLNSLMMPSNGIKSYDTYEAKGNVDETVISDIVDFVSSK